MRELHKYMNNTDYYKILNLNRSSTKEEIKKAYRKLALQYHPDHNPMDEEAGEKSKQINEAYAVLGDSERRRVYDQFGYTGFRKRYSSEDIFNFRSGCTRNMRGFGRGMGCRRRAQFWERSSYFSEQNIFAIDEDVVNSVDITSEEAIYGTEKGIIAKTKLGGRSFKLTIPAGTNNGTRIKLSLKDEDQTVCNLYIQINVKD